MRYSSLVLAVGFSLASIGCSPIYYPNAPHTVLPVERGELVATTGVGSNGVDVRAAFAPAKSVVVAGSLNYLFLPGNDPSYTKHYYGEVALGWADTSGRTFMALLGGAGSGMTATPPGSRFPWDAATFDSARYIRVFAQATIGSLRTPRSIAPGERTNRGFALGLRVSWVKAMELWIDDQSMPPVGDLFIEPHASWQSFGESFGTVVDFGISLVARRGLRFHHSPLRLGVGIVYGFADLF
jgi:hypothetical protein